MVAEEEAVIGGEDDRCIVFNAHVLDFAEKATDPCVDHGYLAAVTGEGGFEIAFGEGLRSRASRRKEVG